MFVFRSWLRSLATHRRQRSAPRFRPLLEALEDRLAPATMTFVVTNDGDSAAPGSGSLRRAILDANANPNDPGVPDRIIFHVANNAVAIHPLTALPTITEAVVIDGTPKPGFENQEIRLFGDMAPAGTDGLTITSGGSTVEGLAIGLYSTGSAIVLTGAGATNNVVTDDFIGTVPAGQPAYANLIGVSIRAGASNNTLGPDNAIVVATLGGLTGQGQTFLGFTDVATDAAGNAGFTATVAAIPLGQVVTATATSSATGDTSEFSAGLLAPTLPPAPPLPPPPLPAPAAPMPVKDVTPSLTLTLVRARFNRLSRQTRLWVLLTNNGPPLHGPISFVLDDLTRGIRLLTRSGVTAVMTPAASPFQDLVLGAAAHGLHRRCGSTGPDALPGGRRRQPGVPRRGRNAEPPARLPQSQGEGAPLRLARAGGCRVTLAREQGLSRLWAGCKPEPAASPGKPTLPHFGQEGVAICFSPDGVAGPA
jgi:hypothetical protein